MIAAVYRGPQDVRIEELPRPQPGPGEVLLKVRACGVCPTDLKKIKDGLLPPPRIYGHETAGQVEALGPEVDGWKPGDKAALYHHVGCGRCELCLRGEDGHCPQYLRVGATAGFEPAGGGYAQFVLAKAWIVKGGGLVRIPDGVGFEDAAFLEPVNTCVKAVRRAGLDKSSRILIMGAGPIGLLMMAVCRSRGLETLIFDPRPDREARALALGAAAALKPGSAAGRLDAVFVCAPGEKAVIQALEAVAPGGRVVLFANTKQEDFVNLNAGDICRNDKVVLGSYSSSRVDDQEAASLVFGGKLKLKELVSHRFPLERAPEALSLAMNPTEGCFKVLILP